MADLKTTYLGLDLKNPIIAGASTITKNVDTIKRLEDAGAAAIVTSSLFEEEIALERYKFDEDLSKFDFKHAEMADVFPELEHAGPEEHLMWVRRAKESVSIPVFGSLNAVRPETLQDYAKKLEQTGIDGLELNLYRFPDDPDETAEKIEAEQKEQLKDLLKTVSVPLSVKLSPFYTNPLNFICSLDSEGVEGYVLFNRFFQPDIDIDKETNSFPFHLSNREDSRLPLRYTGLLFGQVNGDICSSTGIMSGEDVVRMILAGASCVQVVSALYRNKITSLEKMLKTVEEWMDKKGYASLNDFRGKLSRKNSEDTSAYTRAQYVKLLLHPEIIKDNFPVL